MTTIPIMLVAITLSLIVYVYDRAMSKAQSRWFIERQQLQSKIDSLTEHILQSAGHPVDLNKIAREKFRQSVEATKHRAFQAGWKTDMPATPPPSSPPSSPPPKEKS